MKAVILEIVKGRAVVMKADGSVAKIRNKNYSVGDEIYMKEGIFSHRRWAPIVAALLIFAMVGTGTWVYATPAYEISMIEEEGHEILIRVNKYDKVLDVLIRDEDGEEVSIDKDLEKMDLESVLEYLKDNYEIDWEAGYIITTTTAKDDDDTEDLTSNVRDRISVNEEIKVNGLTTADVEDAKDLGITPGKYNIVKNLMGEEVVEDYLDYLEDEYDLDDEDEGYYKDLSKKIMEEFSARNGEKNNPPVNAPGQEDKDDKEEKEIPYGQKVKEEKQKENKPEVDPDDYEDGQDESGRPEKTTGKPEGVGNSKGNSGN